jgi:hypothetical protein
VDEKGGAKFFNRWLLSIDGDTHFIQLSPQLRRYNSRVGSRFDGLELACLALFLGSLHLALMPYP